jgi:hypothetical protein
MPARKRVPARLIMQNSMPVMRGKAVDQECLLSRDQTSSAAYGPHTAIIKAALSQYKMVPKLSAGLDAAGKIGGEAEELVLSTKRTSQPEPVEAQNALEMCDSISIFFRHRTSSPSRIRPHNGPAVPVGNQTRTYR